MSNPLTYQSGENLLPEDFKFKISPSSFSSFVTTPWSWYRTQILKKDQFEYNTSSVIGTVVHYCAECVAKGEEPDRDAIDEYINSFANNEDYYRYDVTNHFPAMAERLINDYVIPNRDSYLEVEPFKYSELANKIYVGGSLDAIQGTKEDAMIIDYKTYNSKTKPKSIPSYYKYQLLTYAYILKENGYNPTRIRLVYINRNIDGGISEKTGKALKSYAPEVTELTEVITQEDLDFIKNQLMLCVDTLEASDKHPELRHIIWHDWRLSMES